MDTFGLYNELHGYSGGVIRVAIKNEASIRFGVVLPNRFYGVQDGAVDDVFRILNEALSRPDDLKV